MDFSPLLKLLPNKVQATSYMLTALGNSGWIYNYITDKLCTGSTTVCEPRDLITQIATIATPAIIALIWGQLNKTTASQVANIKTLPTEAAVAAVANLPDAAKADIKLAAIPDKAILAAANAMPDVTKIEVKPTATDGVGAALADNSLSKIVSAAVAEVKP